MCCSSVEHTCSTTASSIHTTLDTSVWCGRVHALSYLDGRTHLGLMACTIIPGTTVMIDTVARSSYWCHHPCSTNGMMHCAHYLCTVPVLACSGSGSPTSYHHAEHRSTVGGCGVTSSYLPYCMCAVGVATPPVHPGLLWWCSIRQHTCTLSGHVP